MNVSDILSDLSDHGFEDTGIDRKLAVINETLWDVAGLESWTTLVKGVTLTFAGGSATPSNMPTDFRQLVSVGRADAAASRLLKFRLDDFVAKYSNALTAAGPPTMYYFEGATLKFYPVPLNTNTVRMDYVYVPVAVDETTLEASVWLPKQYHRQIIVNGALYRLYLMEDDPELAQQFLQLYDRGIERAKNTLDILDYKAPRVRRTAIKSPEMPSGRAGA